MQRLILALPALLLAALAATTPACFDRPTPACAFLCDDDGTCPDGYRCAPDQWCKRTDVPTDFECGPSAAPDAALPDAPSADAAAPDAMPPDAPPADAATSPDANGAALR